MMGKTAKAGMALVWAAALIGGSATAVLAQTKELSDKSVLTLMHYAWTMVPDKFTTPLGKTITVGEPARNQSYRKALFPKRKADPLVETGAILAALPDPVLVVDGGDRLRYANAAAEQFFDTSAATLLAASLSEYVPIGILGNA